MFSLFLIVILLLVLCDSYILYGVMATSALWTKYLFSASSVVYIAVILYIIATKDAEQRTLNLLVWLTLCILIPTVLFTVSSLLGRGIGLAFPPAARIMNGVGILLSALWIAISLYGILFGWKRNVVERVTITSEKIPASFNGYKIVQLSDFHIGTYAFAPACVEQIVERVNALHPDLIVFTGDLVNTSSTEVQGFTDILSRLHAKDGIYSILGNHDYCTYRRYRGNDTPAKQLAKVIALEKEVGWNMLRNSSRQIVRGTDSIALVGVDNAGSGKFPDNSDLTGALKGVAASEYKILLSHDPSHWRREVLPKSDIDLTLSGHTHAMQFRIFGWSPSAWMYPEWGGLYEADGQQLYVSTGVGENIAFRFGAWPQIVEITLRSK